ncbi:Ubiquitin carboxyl-terminal hydrolase 16 [Smittium mucronatum]|uniref:ubiquitinyl hydrolase 1 n=1 Tax=Smittium mucronatum TaxID=133383 RepID=A0A1R0H2Q2_9FUNG|nr:Ubiquitin carboxyl-terminal hydrolase 16 [Smittium mucronatum]
MGRVANWVSSRDEQDAQEFFQILMQTFQKVKKPHINPILSSLKNPPFHKGAPIKNAEVFVELKNPFIGLAASKIACITCGYTASLSHYSTDCISLPVPRKKNCTIYECLSSYTVIDQLDDFRCRKCILTNSISENNFLINRLKAEIRDYQKQINKLSNHSSSENMTDKIGSSDKLSDKLNRLIKLLNHSESTLENIIESNKKIEFALKNDPELDLGDMCLSKKSTGLSTRQTMIARLPQLLCLHLNRSIYTNTGDVVKNDCKISLDPILDMAPYLTTGYLDTRPLHPISSISKTKDSASRINTDQQNSKFELISIVSHLGSHNSGHYYTYKRIPYINPSDNSKSNKKYQWYRVSDSDFTPYDESSVFNVGNAFMLFYSRIE